jgi:hypothetical protein
MDLQKGDCLEVELVNQKPQHSFSARVMGLGDGWARLAIPDEWLELCRVGTLLRLFFSRKDDASYEALSRVTEWIESGFDPDTFEPFRLVKVEVPRGFLRNQRRSYVRVNVQIRVDLLYFYQDQVPITALTAESLNLSAEGVRLLTLRPFEPGARLMILLLLPQAQGVEEIYTHAEVVRSEFIPETETASPARYGTALKFLRISQINMKKILKFVYKQQELQAKSLI